MEHSATSVVLACLLAASAVPATALGQTAQAASSQAPTVTETVVVIEKTPLPGTLVPADQLPSPVQTATGRDLRDAGVVDVSSFLNARLGSVHVNETQGNPFQVDVNYRGYTASPLLGTPQGISVYLDGVRMNQPFGDVVSWDLIPRSAIASLALMSGSNPVFGLNTLGGALSMQTKDGWSSPGTSVQATYGRSMRRALEFEHGGSRAGGFSWFATGQAFAEDGWRDASPTDLDQLFGKVAWRRANTDVSLSVAGVDDELTGNGLQEWRLLEHDYRSVYTKPDVTKNRSALVNLSAQRRASATVTLSGTAYYRHLRTRTLNGDLNDDALDQSLYQPGSAERAALAAAGYTGVPASGATAENTPFPFWRCLGNVLLGDEPGEKCNGMLNRSRTRQHNAGIAGQMTWLDSPQGGRHQLTIGAAFDHSDVRFGQSSELGYLTPDRGVTGTGAFADGVTGGEVDGDPFDTRVDLDGQTTTSSVYATDTWRVGARTHVTASGRYNRTVVSNRDRIRPGGEEGSLDGDHVFARFNPAVGFAFRASDHLGAYGNYGESSRAATSIELGCADPDTPCKLPNAMAGDPPLEQVVSRTWEAGVRGAPARGVNWTAGWFDAANRNDILFVASTRTGFGYFTNVGETRRRGVELNLNARVGAVSFGGAYTWLDATYQTAETVDGTGNSSNDEARAGLPGVDGTIDIEPGDRIPLIPRHIVKAYADARLTTRLAVDVNVLGVSSAFARGNENNQHQPDGIYYVGNGTTPGYAVLNLGLRYELRPRWQLVAQIDNLLDRAYETGGQLGATGFNPDGTFVARPFPSIDGEFPVRQSLFVAPGAPITARVGVRFTR
jgi:outer membrane receptor protein involved in Fe transport